MALGITITSNHKQQAEQLGIDGRALPRVLSGFLSAMAYDAKDFQQKQMSADMQKPTPFTTRSLSYQRATMARLEASVYVRPRQAEYLHRLLAPGKRVPLHRYVFIPASDQQTNPYGNMPRARRRRVLSGQLVTKPRGRNKLVFAKVGRQMKFVGVFAPETNYRRRTWHFHDHAQTHFDRNKSRIFAAEWARYLRR